MSSRLVLGSGPLAQALVSSLGEGPSETRVLDTDEGAVTTLREEGVDATVGDPTDAEVLRGVVTAPAAVVVATTDPATNAGAATAARRAFPEAFVLGYTGFDATADQRATIDEAADTVLDPGEAVGEAIGIRLGDAGVRVRKLTGVLRSIDGPLAIVTHDNPDPDAIASGVTLARIAQTVGVETDICYYGEITHQENRAFVNLLDYDLTNLDPDADLSGYGGFALVDHSRPGVNDGLPPETGIDVVIDHHPPRMPVEARFVDLRSDVGATSTLMVDYLRQLGRTPAEDVATGLLFGIRVDTDEFTREVSVEDFEAAAFLLPQADLGTLERIESPSVSAETIDTIARAITNRKRHGPVLLSGVGRLGERDALAQAADRLLDLEDVTTTFVYGILDGTVHVSARARGADIDLGETLRDAFGQIGSAGGHADMAGAQISLGLLEAVDESDESLAEVIHDIVSDRFLDAVESRSHRTFSDLYAEEFHAPAARLDSAVESAGGEGAEPESSDGTDTGPAEGSDDTDEDEEGDDTDEDEGSADRADGATDT